MKNMNKVKRVIDGAERPNLARENKDEQKETGGEYFPITDTVGSYELIQRREKEWKK